MPCVYVLKIKDGKMSTVKITTSLSSGKIVINNIDNPLRCALKIWKIANFHLLFLKRFHLTAPARAMKMF